MDRRYRQRFNEAFTDELYRGYRERLSRLSGREPGFRLAETPVFLPPELVMSMTEAADAIIAEVRDPAMIARSEKAIPDAYRAPGRDHLPSFATIDFAIVRGADGTLEPKLIELQGFPSLFMFEVFQRDAWVETIAAIPGLDRDWSCWFSGLDRESFIDLARETIVGPHDPQDVCLIDIEPSTQKTNCDFSSTTRLLGVPEADVLQLELRGRQLFRRDENGRSRRILRIYNRVIADELVRRNAALPFDFREELDVEWVAHPDWYWIWSKYTLPFLEHPSVPESILLSDLDVAPDDLETAWVLKPLFSFAGVGVNVEPTVADLNGVPDDQKGLWCIQRKVEYAGVLEAADGGSVKAEVRMMYLRPRGTERMVLAENLVRLARGKMLGVDYNKDFTWVGSSIGLH